MKTLAAFARLSILAPILAVGAAACGSSSSASNDTSAGAITASSNEHWFYDGPIPALEDVHLTISHKGHTVRADGLLPVGTPQLYREDVPHGKISKEGSRTRLHLVYPIATARPEKTNAEPGSYGISEGKLFRPDGKAFTKQEGEHWVPWGGFPFLPYTDDGIALHGPISEVRSGDPSQVEADLVWTLRRGRVSGGCNRMMGEHVVELAAVIGFDMHTVHEHDRLYSHPGGAVPVTVIDDYDTFDGKLVDVDYPTDVGAERPQGNVVMFGSWVATRTDDGSDLPPATDGYVYADHAVKHRVCSIEGGSMAVGTKVPQGFCADK